MRLAATVVSGQARHDEYCRAVCSLVLIFILLLFTVCFCWLVQAKFFGVKNKFWSWYLGALAEFLKKIDLQYVIFPRKVSVHKTLTLIIQEVIFVGAIRSAAS